MSVRRGLARLPQPRICRGLSCCELADLLPPPAPHYSIDEFSLCANRINPCVHLLLPSFLHPSNSVAAKHSEILVQYSQAKAKGARLAICGLSTCTCNYRTSVCLRLVTATCPIRVCLLVRPPASLPAFVPFYLQA